MAKPSGHQPSCQLPFILILKRTHRTNLALLLQPLKTVKPCLTFTNEYSSRIRIWLNIYLFRIPLYHYTLMSQREDSPGAGEVGRENVWWISSAAFCSFIWVSSSGLRYQSCGGSSSSTSWDTVISLWYDLCPWLSLCFLASPASSTWWHSNFCAICVNKKGHLVKALLQARHWYFFKVMGGIGIVNNRCHSSQVVSQLKPQLLTLTWHAQSPNVQVELDPLSPTTISLSSLPWLLILPFVIWLRTASKPGTNQNSYQIALLSIVHQLSRLGRYQVLLKALHSLHLASMDLNIVSLFIYLHNFTLSSS